MANRLVMQTLMASLAIAGFTSSGYANESVPAIVEPVAGVIQETIALEEAVETDPATAHVAQASIVLAAIEVQIQPAANLLVASTSSAGSRSFVGTGGSIFGTGGSIFGTGGSISTQPLPDPQPNPASDPVIVYLGSEIQEMIDRGNLRRAREIHRLRMYYFMTNYPPTIIRGRPRAETVPSTPIRPPDR